MYNVGAASANIGYGVSISFHYEPGHRPSTPTACCGTTVATERQDIRREVCAAFYGSLLTTWTVVETTPFCQWFT